MYKNQIEPSSDFTQRTIQKALEIKQKRDMISKILFSLLMFIPFAMREIWLFVRHDYFSISRMPFHEIIFSTYSFMLSNIAFYVLLGASVIVASLYFLGRRQLLVTIKSFSQIFNQARARI